MNNKNYLEELNNKAIRFFKDKEFTHAAVAVSGSEQSIVLLNAAMSSMGAENVLAIVADTGYIKESVFDVLQRACDAAGVELCVLPVMLTVDDGENADCTFDYKRQVFEDMLNECWMIGVDNLCYACTDENKHINGNEVIETFDGVYAPFVTEE